MAKIKEILSSGGKTVISLEVTPPEKGSSISDIFRPLDQLMDFGPQFINVTYHQPYVEFVEENGEIQKQFRSKKPGTVGVSSARSSPLVRCGRSRRRARRAMKHEIRQDDDSELAVVPWRAQPRVQYG